MKLKLLAVIAALFLVSACETQTATAPGPSSIGNPTPGSKEDFIRNVGDRVFYDYDSYQLRPEARATLVKQATWLKQYSQYRITIEGHCDERGTREYNLALGERRAAAVKSFLVSQGIPAARIGTISYGKERPDPVGSDESAWSRQRRGQTTLSN